MSRNFAIKELKNIPTLNYHEYKEDIIFTLSCLDCSEGLKRYLLCMVEYTFYVTKVSGFYHDGIKFGDIGKVLGSTITFGSYKSELYNWYIYYSHDHVYDKRYKPALGYVFVGRDYTSIQNFDVKKCCDAKIETNG